MNIRRVPKPGWFLNSSIIQTVEIPASHRLFLDLPMELPAGKAKITITPEAELPANDSYAVVENLRGIAKRMGSTLTVERFLELGREDAEREEAEYCGLFSAKD